MGWLRICLWDFVTRVQFSIKGCTDEGAEAGTEYARKAKEGIDSSCLVFPNWGMPSC